MKGRELGKEVFSASLMLFRGKKQKRMEKGDKGQCSSSILLQLPNELLVMILSHLDGRELGKCCLVCRAVHVLIHSHEGQQLLWLPLLARLLGLPPHQVKTRVSSSSKKGTGGEKKEIDWRALFIDNMLCHHWNAADTTPGYEVSWDQCTLRRVGSYVIRGWGAIRAGEPCKINQFFEGFSLPPPNVVIMLSDHQSHTFLIFKSKVKVIRAGFNLGIGVIQKDADLKCWHHLIYHCNAMRHIPYSTGAVIGIQVTLRCVDDQDEEATIKDEQHWLVHYFIGDRYSHSKTLPYRKDVPLYPAALGYGEETFKIAFCLGSHKKPPPHIPNTLCLID